MGAARRQPLTCSILPNLKGNFLKAVYIFSKMK